MSPWAPRRACSAPRCPNLQPCPLHARRPWDHGGLSAAQRGYGRAWRDGVRPRILARDGYLCQPCLRAGRPYVPATTVDHITPKARGGTDDPANLEAACARCQQRKAGREGRQAQQ